LGSLPAVKAQLADYTTFDSFQRNFIANLSGILATKTATGATAIGTISPPVASSTAHFAGGGELTVAASDMDAAGAEAQQVAALRLSDRAIGLRDPQMLYLSFTDGRGDLAAIGRGGSSTLSFASALYGPNAPAAFQSNTLEVSGALTRLAQGGDFAAAGVELPGGARVAFSLSSTPLATDWNGAPSQTLPQASALSAGVSFKLAARWTLGATYSALNQKNGLLGATYSSLGLIDLGASHHSQSLGASTAYALGGGRSLMVDAAVTRSNGAEPNAGFVGGVSAVTARAYGVSLVQSDAWQAGDQLSIALRKPLRVISGDVRLAVTSVDADGNPVTTLTPLSLRPDGDETDLSLAYATPVKAGFRLSAGVDYRDQAENVRDLTDVALRLALQRRF
jgi:hypothetical protein